MGDAYFLGEPDVLLTTTATKDLSSNAQDRDVTVGLDVTVVIPYLRNRLESSDRDAVTAMDNRQNWQDGSGNPLRGAALKTVVDFVRGYDEASYEQPYEPGSDDEGLVKNAVDEPFNVHVPFTSTVIRVERDEEPGVTSVEDQVLAVYKSDGYEVTVGRFKGQVQVSGTAGVVTLD